MGCIAGRSGNDIGEAEQHPPEGEDASCSILQLDVAMKPMVRSNTAEESAIIYNR